MKHESNPSHVATDFPRDADEALDALAAGLSLAEVRADMATGELTGEIGALAKGAHRHGACCFEVFCASIALPIA